MATASSSVVSHPVVFTTQTPYPLPSQKFMLPASWRRYQLSQLVNKALSLAKPVSSCLTSQDRFGLEYDPVSYLILEALLYPSSSRSEARTHKPLISFRPAMHLSYDYDAA